MRRRRERSRTRSRGGAQRGLRADLRDERRDRRHGPAGGLPRPGGRHFRQGREGRPSVVVEGWAAEDLEKLYDEWHERFEESDYEITFDEQEEHDAEISFEGGGRSGQVKLASECG